MGNFIDLTGKRFGRLIVVEFDRFGKNSQGYWLCKCDCGNEKSIFGCCLRNGTTKSCGCLQTESITKHGLCYTKFYKFWEDMKKRCKNKNVRSYPDYGGRGITYDPKWETFLGFKDDMWNRYQKYYRLYGNKTSLERIDVNGNYCKENCTFIHKRDQLGNRRNNRWFKAIDPDGNEYISKNQSGFAKKHNLLQGNINKCLQGLRYQHRDWTFRYLGDNK